MAKKGKGKLKDIEVIRFPPILFPDEDKRSTVEKILDNVICYSSGNKATNTNEVKKNEQSVGKIDMEKQRD